MKTNFRFPSGTGCSGRLLHGALHTLAAALLLFAGSACENEDPDVYTPPAPEPLAPLTLVPNMDPRVQNDIEIEEETTGVYRIHTTGEDPISAPFPSTETSPPTSTYWPSNIKPTVARTTYSSSSGRKSTAK